VILGTLADQFLAPFVSMLSNERLEAVVGDERLRTAIELLCAAPTELSPRARFLTLGNVLEVLAPHIPKPPAVQAFSMLS
jgi:hypothetical protein